MESPEPPSGREGLRRERAPKTLFLLPSRVRRAAEGLGSSISWDEVMRGEFHRFRDYERFVCGPVEYRPTHGAGQHPEACRLLRELLLRGAAILFLLPRRDPLARGPAVLRDVTGAALEPFPASAKASVRAARGCPEAVRRWIERHPAHDLVQVPPLDVWGAGPSSCDPWVVLGEKHPVPVVAPVVEGEGSWLTLPLETTSHMPQDLAAALVVLDRLQKERARGRPVKEEPPSPVDAGGEAPMPSAPHADESLPNAPDFASIAIDEAPPMTYADLAREAGPLLAARGETPTTDADTVRKRVKQGTRSTLALLRPHCVPGGVRRQYAEIFIAWLRAVHGRWVRQQAAHLAEAERRVAGTTGLVPRAPKGAETRGK